ncbi:restriction endonuclease subunit S [Micrococcus luteus]|nr:restriction endonuclease subunit S [Micrococcus luteus]
MKNKHTPEVRFAGFTDAWEQRKLGDILKTHQFRSYLANPAEEGNYEVIQQGDKPVIGYANGNPFNNYKDVILFGDHTVSLYKPVKPFFVATDGVKILSADGIEGNFLFTLLERYKPEPQGYKRHFTILKNESCWITGNSEEQEQLGTFFNNLDHLITLHQRELTTLKQTKQGFLQKMFPREGETVPEVRFPGFTGDWEQREMGNLIEQVIREVPKPDTPYERLSVRSHAKGTFHQYVDDPSTVAMEKLYIVRKKDLIVNITFAWEHAIAVANDLDDGLYVSHRFPTYRADGKSDIEFLRYMVSQEEFRQKLELISPGGAGRNRVLSKKDFMKIEVVVPKNIEEQTKIGSFFNELDKTITLHQRELDALNKTKQAFLQKMFI